MVELIRSASPRLTLIGEFWPGFSDLRIDLVDGSRRLTKNEAIFPSSIGMDIDLHSCGIICSRCKGKASPDKVRIFPPTEEFGLLNYACPRCTLGK